MVLGPTPCVINKIKDEYRFNLIVKNKLGENGHRTILRFLRSIKLPSDIKMVVDIDPADVIADALEQGPLRNAEITLPQSIVDKIADEAPEIKTEWISALICYYIQNRQPDSDWVILPASNFDAYFGTTTFSHKKLKTIPQTIIFRDQQVCGLTRYKVMPEFLS